MNNKLFYKSGYIWIQNVPEFMDLYFVLSPNSEKILQYLPASMNRENEVK